MKNIEMQIKDGRLLIQVDLNKQIGPSKSGKTIIIATTEGNTSLPDRPEVIIGMNVYTKKS